MNSTVKGIITVLIVGGAVYASYKLFFSDKKKKYAELIYDKGKHKDYKFLLTMQEGYLKQWYSAVQSGAETFVFEGSTYKTQGGTKIK